MDLLGTLPNVQIAAQMPGSDEAERSQRVTRRATVRQSGAEFKTPSFAVRFTNSGLVSIAAQSSKLSATKLQSPRISSRLLRPAFRLLTRLAVGFGLEALPASGWIHPGRGQAVAYLGPPFLGAED